MIALPNGSQIQAQAQAAQGLLVQTAREIYVRNIMYFETDAPLEAVKCDWREIADFAFDAASAFMTRLGLPCEIRKPEQPPCNSSDETKN